MTWLPSRQSVSRAPPRPVALQVAVEGDVDLLFEAERKRKHRSADDEKKRKKEHKKEHKKKHKKKRRKDRRGADDSSSSSSSSDSDTIRSSISGKKIKRKLDRSAADLQHQKSRQQLLQFYNGMFD
ncbi:hypothetical protein BBJ28_00001412 [Nothophytophthora sp. Chile5]|nr:hypothetical protein BBJ28_00001412 [Nothophytophthora sp. Chile5]